MSLDNLDRLIRLTTCQDCGTDKIGRSNGTCWRCGGKLVAVVYHVLTGARLTYAERDPRRHDRR